ncbi:MAG: Photosystem I assembly protein Ycf3 [Phycisphaerae bacterium]|nr:Photosystem I assembly protein Ycf3 [Phycisphaerae bacterium]
MKRWVWLIPVALAFVTRWPALNGQMVWDDKIVAERQMVAFRTTKGEPFPIKSVFFPPAGLPEWASTYYRPTVVYTYLIDQWLFGRDGVSTPLARSLGAWFAPGSMVGPHFMVLLYHAIVTFFVWLLARQVLANLHRREWGALVAASLFAAHPILSESVCWLTGRSDTVAAMFMLPSIVCALACRDRPRLGEFRAIVLLLLATLTCLAALLAKEVAFATLLVVPPLLLVVPPARRRCAGCSTWLAGNASECPRCGPLGDDSSSIAGVFRRPAWHWLALGVGYALAAAVYFVLRYRAEVNAGRAIEGARLGDLFRRSFDALGFYVQKVVVPYPQSTFVTEFPPLLVSLAACAGLFLALALSVGALCRRMPAYLVAVGWFGLMLAPSLAIAVRNISETPVAERYLYLPAVGFCLAVGALAAWMASHRLLRPVGLLAAATLIGVFGSVSVARCAVWQSNEALWTDATAKNKTAGLPIYSLSQVYFDKSRVDSQIRLGLPPALETALGAVWRGVMPRLRGEYARLALDLCRQSLELYDDDEGKSLATNTIAAILMSDGKYDEAEVYLRQSIKIRPKYPTPYFNLGVIAQMRAESQFRQTRKHSAELLSQAHEHLKIAIGLNPNYVKALLQIATCEASLATAYFQSGDTEQARAMLKSAEERVNRIGIVDRASFPKALNDLALVQLQIAIALMNARDYANAREMFLVASAVIERMMKMAPDSEFAKRVPQVQQMIQQRIAAIDAAISGAASRPASAPESAPASNKP